MLHTIHGVILFEVMFESGYILNHVLYSYLYAFSIVITCVHLA